MLVLPRKSSLERLGDHELDLLTRLVYNPFTGILYRQRYRSALSLIHRGMNRILEVGYGAGLLLPSLAKRCDRLYGVDIHSKATAVQRMLSREGCVAELKDGSITDLPFRNSYLDLVVCLSVAEHLRPSELADAMAEIKRVLRAEGELVLGFPVKNALTSLLFRAVGFDDQIGHPSSHTSIVAVVRDYFKISQTVRYPLSLPLNCCLYVVLRCTC